jgi:hypothetical protein
MPGRVRNADCRSGGAVRRLLAPVAAAAVVCGLLAGGGVASAAGTGHAAVPKVRWGRAEEVPGLAALNAGGSAGVGPVSCWRAGDCVAGGSYTDASGHSQAFVVTEHNSVWGQAIEVPGTAALNTGGGAGVSAISCAPRGGCAVAGTYHDSAGNQQVFVDSATGGRWGTAIQIPGTGKLNVGGLASVHSVSCASAGNCAAGGYYQLYNPPGTGDNAFQAYVVSERNGRWASAEEVPGIAAINPPPNPDGAVVSVSCASAGNCTAGGFWWGGPCAFGAAVCPLGFVVSEVDGRWQRLVLPKGGGTVSEVSCWRAGDCTAAGAFLNPSSGAPLIGFAENETNGRWASAHLFAASLNLGITSVSCTSAGNCSAGGNMGGCECDAGFLNGAFVFSEHKGRWGAVDDLAGPANLGTVNSVSCASAGNCGAGGSGYAGNDEYGDVLYQAFVVGERDGRWAAAEVPPGMAALNLGGNSAVNSVSCPAAGSCAAGGSYTDAAGHAQGWVDGSK